jgi:hypothetical protein
MTPAGLPHSEIPGSKRVCRSPRLIAACRVLHRRSAPRHPPFTLSSLAIKYLRREFTNLVHSFAFYYASCSILLSKTFRPALDRRRNSCSEARTPRPALLDEVGGADRDRTDDLRLAKPPLSQLSYSPSILSRSFASRAPVRASWWAWIDLNYRPHAYQACALTS